eukprot:TRINITY_DN5335_c0_g1_i1.p1 TRINITY_DN5335_c0_g1~~TRINITY_DN5335_c0_g1_i1.p1  ORF type:complete len:328 (+),score=41.96 TRINITY_DN5335_c0_g1_i1:125-1108(+)
MCLDTILKCVGPRSKNVLRSHLTKSGLRPVGVAYWNTALSWCSKNNEDVGAMYQQMRRAGVSPSVVTFNIVLRAFSKLGRREVVNQLFSHMKSTRINPNEDTISSLLIHTSIDEFEKLTEQHSLTVTQASKYLQTCTSFPDMKQVVERMNAFEVPTDVIFWCQFMIVAGRIKAKGALSYVLKELHDRRMASSITEKLVSVALKYASELCGSGRLSEAEIEAVVIDAEELYRLRPHNNMVLHEQMMFVFAAAGCRIRAEVFVDEVLDARGNTRTPTFSRAFSLTRKTGHSELHLSSYHSSEHTSALRRSEAPIHRTPSSKQRRKVHLF